MNKINPRLYFHGDGTQLNPYVPVTQNIRYHAFLLAIIISIETAPESIGKDYSDTVKFHTVFGDLQEGYVVGGFAAGVIEGACLAQGTNRNSLNGLLYYRSVLTADQRLEADNKILSSDWEHVQQLSVSVEG